MSNQIAEDPESLFPYDYVFLANETDEELLGEFQEACDAELTTYPMVRATTVDNTEMPDDMEAALEIAGHLEQYEILPDHLRSPKEYAAFVLERENIHVDEKLSPFVDYGSFGRYCMKRDRIVQTGKGPILRKDRPIEFLPDELSEIRLFSPLKAELYRKVGWGDLSAEPEEILAYELCEYEDSITEQIAGEWLN